MAIFINNITEGSAPLGFIAAIIFSTSPANCVRSYVSVTGAAVHTVPE